MLRAVIFGYPVSFPEDTSERLVADAATARKLAGERCPQLLELLAHRRQRFAPLLAQNPNAPVQQAEDAILVAFCRLAYRHGSWGKDFHHYHNEGHIFEILGSRLERLIDTIGLETLSLRDWFLLTLFAAAHDLRQREVPEFAAGIGANERASIEETFRILQICGFTRERNADVFFGIELMIAGSTFDARPPPKAREYNSAEIVMQSGGALASRLDHKLDKYVPSWRNDEHIAHALELALIAADLDTANVAEPFPLFMASAERLCLEREMRSYRDVTSAESAQPMLGFFTKGQEHYFFDLHRFNSEYGRATFGAGKLANIEPVRSLIHAMAALPAPRTGDDVLQAFRQLVAKYSEP